MPTATAGAAVEATRHVGARSATAAVTTKPIPTRASLTLTIPHPLTLHARAQAAAAVREPRPLLAMVATPLAGDAAILLGQWTSLLLLAIAAWWWSPRTWRWSWLLPLEAALVGGEWMYVGAYCLAHFPHDTALVGLAWVGAAVLLAGACHHHRSRGGEGY